MLRFLRDDKSADTRCHQVAVVQVVAVKRNLLVVLAGLALIVAVFGLKVWHAVGVCHDLHGRWSDGDCHFDEPASRSR